MHELDYIYCYNIQGLIDIPIIHYSLHYTHAQLFVGKIIIFTMPLCFHSFIPYAGIILSLFCPHKYY